jgi:hypothetical protein
MEKVKALKEKVRNVNWLIILAIIADVALIVNIYHKW